MKTVVPSSFLLTKKWDVNFIYGNVVQKYFLFNILKINSIQTSKTIFFCT